MQPKPNTSETVEENANMATIDNTPVFTRAELVAKLVNYASSADNASLAQTVEDITKAAPGAPPLKPSSSGDGANKASIKAVKEELDVALEGEELSEEFKTKAATLFEVAVLGRVAVLEAELQETFKSNLETATEELKTEMETKISMFLEMVAETWVEENKVAITSSVKAELAESFIEGLKTVFEEHYIDVPDDKVDIVEEMTKRIEELELLSNQKIQETIDQKKIIDDMKVSTAIAEVSESLVETQKDKFKTLAEGLSYDNLEDLRAKLVVIKETHFKDGVSSKGEPSIITESAPEDNSSTKTKVIDPVMASYVAALSRSS